MRRRKNKLLMTKPISSPPLLQETELVENRKTKLEEISDNGSSCEIFTKTKLLKEEA